MRIITVSREFGSGGREIAKRLSDILGITYYDKEILTEIAEQSNLNEEYVARTLNKGLHLNIPIHYARSFSYVPLTDDVTRLLAIQRKIIMELAEKEDCIIVGRGANVILKAYSPLRIFVYADLDSKIARCLERMNDGEQLSRKELEKRIQKIDKARASSYEILSSGVWGDKREYDLCINTTNVSIPEMIPCVADYASRVLGL